MNELLWREDPILSVRRFHLHGPGAVSPPPLVDESVLEGKTGKETYAPNSKARVKRSPIGSWGLRSGKLVLTQVGWLRDNPLKSSGRGVQELRAEDCRRGQLLLLRT